MQFADFRSANLFRLLTHHVRPGTVLDVGCGGGGMVAWLVEHGHDARGIDLNADTVAAARRLASRGRDPMRVSCGSPAEIIPTGLTLDNVISMDTLEHNEDDQRAFAQLVELTRPGGRRIVTVPALLALFGPRDRDMGHFRRYSRESLCALSTIFGTGT
ncbi:MAG: class I SAM-dependent methyltransferase [Chromatiales bacterium]